MKIYNCPNCGAPIANDICPYCGTGILDWSALELGKENWVKIKFNGEVVLIKALLYNFRVNYECPNSTYLYADNQVYYQDIGYPDIDIEMELHTVPFRIPGQDKPIMSLNVNPEVADLHKIGELMKGARES